MRNRYEGYYRPPPIRMLRPIYTVSGADSLDSEVAGLTKNLAVVMGVSLLAGYVLWTRL